MMQRPLPRYNIVKAIGKGQKESHVFLPATVREALPKYMKVRRSGDTNRILVFEKGEPLTYDGLRQEIYQISKKQAQNSRLTGQEDSMQDFSTNWGLTLKSCVFS